MNEKTRCQSLSGKQGTKNLQELSEWDKILLDDMDNGFIWYLYIKEKRLQTEKRAKEQREK